MLRPPGPKPHFLIGNIPLAGRDPLAIFTRWAAEYGDVFYYRAAWLHVYFLNRPDLIDYVLVRNPQNFLKDRVVQNSRWLLGTGLLTAEGEYWKRQRRIVQPAFSRERIASYTRYMTDTTEQMLATWKSGTVLDIHEEMMAVTLRVVLRALFEIETVETTKISKCLNTVMLNSIGAKLLTPPFFRFLPLPGMRNIRRAVDKMNAAVYGIIRERRGRQERRSDDLLSMLMNARDEDGSSMTDEQLRDELMTFLLAGHETTALAVSWALYLLSQNAEAEARLHDEVDRVPRGRLPAISDVPSLNFTERVLKETMRLYPPAWSVARTAVNEFELDGYRIPGGANIVMSQWIMHRDARYFPDPEKFAPDRWSTAAERVDFMAHQRQHPNLIFGLGLRPVLSLLALTMVFMLAVMAQSALAQTYSVIHNFTGGGDGANPYGGLAIDGGGNLYGTTLHGAAGFGGVFKLKRSAFGFTFNPLYNFTGGSDGAGPVSGVVFGPNGTLYGTAHAGGEQNCTIFGYPGCGLVFNLRPQATFCHSVLCPWTETVLYRFTGGSDGANPWGNVTFDHSGNLYGTTEFGGITSCTNGCGTVFELMPSGGSWIETVLYSFTNGSDGSRPYAGVTFDTSGNLYGTNFLAAGGGCEGQGCGTVYQLTPSGSGWMQNTIYAYQGGSDGGLPVGGVIFDQSGNLYTSTLSYGSGGTGTVLELSPANGSWTFNLLFSLSGGPRGGPEANLVMDQAGNLYGTAFTAAGAHCCGSVFKLTPSGGTWIYTSLHDFTGSTDGGEPVSTVVFDASGNLYGTTTMGGSAGKGVVWEITP